MRPPPPQSNLRSHDTHGADRLASRPIRVRARSPKDVRRAGRPAPNRAVDVPVDDTWESPGELCAQPWITTWISPGHPLRGPVVRGLRRPPGVDARNFSTSINWPVVRRPDPRLSGDQLG